MSALFRSGASEGQMLSPPTIGARSERRSTLPGGKERRADKNKGRAATSATQVAEVAEVRAPLIEDSSSLPLGDSSCTAIREGGATVGVSIEVKRDGRMREPDN
jgi:hypothetical protein